MIAFFEKTMKKPNCKKLRGTIIDVIQPRANTTSWKIVVLQSHAPITPNFPSGYGRDIVGDYVKE